MANYQPFKKQSFPLKKDALAWAKKIKKQYGNADIKMKIETNYLPSGQWEGVVLMKQNGG